MSPLTAAFLSFCFYFLLSMIGGLVVGTLSAWINASGYQVQWMMAVAGYLCIIPVGFWLRSKVNGTISPLGLAIPWGIAYFALGLVLSIALGGSFIPYTEKGALGLYAMVPVGLWAILARKF